MMEAKVGHNITKDVDHARPLDKGGGNSLSNLRIRSAHANRSFRRTRTGGVK